MSASAKLREATVRLNALIDRLEGMADWRDDLEARLWLVSQYTPDATNRARLEADVHAFHAACFALVEGVTEKHRGAA